jgi:bacteriocin-like protein
LKGVAHERSGAEERVYEHAPQPDAENKKKQSPELNDEELNKVSGGDLSLNYTKIEYTNTTQK